MRRPYLRILAAACSLTSSSCRGALYLLIAADLPLPPFVSFSGPQWRWPSYAMTLPLVQLVAATPPSVATVCYAISPSTATVCQLTASSCWVKRFVSDGDGHKTYSQVTESTAGKRAPQSVSQRLRMCSHCPSLCRMSTEIHRKQKRRNRD